MAESLAAPCEALGKGTGRCNTLRTVACALDGLGRGYRFATGALAGAVAGSNGTDEGTA